ncbi:helix-turn-helix domain-containing protein [Foetidibacter luteolus]|uniref:helix-turn-helix domain-containing protein n=1 Tax=Foetidibacter luteolus TaxID=2608880 RepID=UPI00129A6AF1|nr:AraC family transcriptional regulator [Foetidibacter luteolus]
MDLPIKNMVCTRCIKVVGQVLQELLIPFERVELGKAVLQQPLTAQQQQQLEKRLKQEGFDIVEDAKAATVERIKNLVIDLVYNKDLEEQNENLSVYLSRQLHKDYSTLSQLFSTLENTTIEQFFILQKIERVKEMLVYDGLSLSEIAWKMGYSSVAHLSNQFKKITGFTPGSFKKVKEHKRKPIDEIG